MALSSLRAGGRVRRLLGSRPFWEIMFVLVAVLVVVRVIQLDRRQARDEARTNNVIAARKAERVARIAEITATYDACVRSIPQLQRVNRFVKGVQRLHVTLYLNALETHEATPKNSAAYRAQTENLARLKAAVLDVSGITFPIPTAQQCADARDTKLQELGDRTDAALRRTGISVAQRRAGR